MVSATFNGKALHDPQANRVYRWETNWGPLWDGQWWTLRETRACFRIICDQYRVPLPKVQMRPRRNGWYSYAHWLDDDPVDYVAFSRRGLNPVATLHEAAHVIAQYAAGRFEEPHGRLWMGVYLRLLVDNSVAPWCALRASLAGTGIAYRPLRFCGPRQIEKMACAYGRNVV